MTLRATDGDQVRVSQETVERKLYLDKYSLKPVSSNPLGTCKGLPKPCVLSAIYKQTF